jgi:hypothetical protein
MSPGIVSMLIEKMRGFDVFVVDLAKEQ